MHGETEHQSSVLYYGPNEHQVTKLEDFLVLNFAGFQVGIRKLYLQLEERRNYRVE